MQWEIPEKSGGGKDSGLRPEQGVCECVWDVLQYSLAIHAHPRWEDEGCLLGRLKSAQTSWETSGYIKLGTAEGGEKGKEPEATTEQLITVDTHNPSSAQLIKER